MNYKKIYDNLIEKAKNRILDGYKESHHIIPRCLGGSNDKENMVNLTPEEHYVAHQLLVKIHPKNYSLIQAASMMIANRPSNKMYGWLKRRHAEAMRHSQLGKNNSQYGTKWIHNKKTKESKKISKTLAIPEGWNEGRYKEVKVANCIYCNAQYVKKTKEKFCGNKCRQYYTSVAIKTIDNNLEDMIEFYLNCKSITRTLVNFGIGDKTSRAGNSYFANILRENNIEVILPHNHLKDGRISKQLKLNAPDP